MLDWTLNVHDTLTGTFQGYVRAADGRWRSAINEAGDGSHTFRLRSSNWKYGQVQNRALFTPWARTIVQCLDGQPVYAGLVRDLDWDDDTGELVVGTSEVRTLLDLRQLFTIGLYATGTLTVTGKSIGGVARAVIRAAAYRPPLGDPWHLPFNYQPDQSGDQSFTFNNYEFQSAGEILDNLAALPGGPDVHFRPVLNGGVLSWDVLIGDPTLHLTTVQVNSLRPAGLLKVKTTIRGDDQLTGVFTIGAGQEAAMLHGEAGNMPGTVIPYRDATRAHKDVADQGTLDALALAELQAYRELPEQFAMDVQLSTASNLIAQGLQPGAVLKFWHPGNEWLAEGWRQINVLGMSGDLTQTVHLEVQ